MRLAAYFSFALLLFLAEPAMAAVYVEVPCGKLPAEAKTALPAPFSSVGQILCTGYGQIIKPADGYFWPKNNSQTIIVAAQKNTKEPAAAKDSIYFTKFSNREVKGAEKEMLAEVLYDKQEDLASKMEYRFKNPDGSPNELKNKEYMEESRQEMIGYIVNKMVMHEFDMTSNDNNYVQKIYYINEKDKMPNRGMLCNDDGCKPFAFAQIKIYR